MGGLTFIIKYNGAFLRPPVPRPLPQKISNQKHEAVKFVDDGTIAVSINLKTCLVPGQSDRARPLKYNERTGHVLPAEDNLLQYFIADTEDFTKSNKMIINKSKTKVIKFSKARNWDFPPELHFSDGSPLECIKETKLVGVMVTQYLRWQRNTDYICGKARAKLWIIRRLLEFNLDIKTLFDVY